MLMLESSSLVLAENRDQELRCVCLVYVALVLMNLADLVYTNVILTHNSADELNPVMNYLYQNFGMVGLSSIKIYFLWVIACFLKYLPELDFCRRAFYGASAVYAVLTGYHLMFYFGDYLVALDLMRDK